MVAERHQMKVNIASNSWFRFGLVNTEINQVMVEKNPDAADDWIAENVKEKDIVLTADIPLAKRCLDKKAYVLRFDGKEFDSSNIGSCLAMRDLHNHIRETGQEIGFNPTFSKKNRSDFLSRLENLIQKAIKQI